MTRQRCFYQADINLQKIPEAQDAVSLLQSIQSIQLSSTLWQKIGICIRQLHDMQIYHHGLDIHNIMLDQQQKVWLIDCVKCAVRAGKRWKSANLHRFIFLALGR